MMKKLLIIQILFSMSLNLLFCQNIIPDGCFLKYQKKSKLYVQNSKHWMSINNGSPDLFTKYGVKNRYGYPKNLAGYAFPVCGDAYVGLFLYKGNSINKSEYITTKLISELQKDSLYCISFYIKLADNSLYAVNTIDIYFSKDFKAHRRYKKLHKIYEPQVSNIGRGIVENLQWTKLCSVYIANGNEKYMSIGNYHKNENMVIKKRDIYNNKRIYINYAYYFIDNVSLIKISSPDECNCNSDTVSISMNDTIQIETIIIPQDQNIVLQNVFFETDKWELLPESFSQLDEITEYLNSNPQLYIEISGHTDNTGNEPHNMQLSDARAQSVANYLITNGIDASRIIAKGFGSSKPIADNDTENGRAINRRVEIFLFEK
jgi:OmpA-OmpF porin, OOP family